MQISAPFSLAYIGDRGSDYLTYGKEVVCRGYSRGERYYTDAYVTSAPKEDGKGSIYICGLYKTWDVSRTAFYELVPGHCELAPGNLVLAPWGRNKDSAIGLRFMGKFVRVVPQLFGRDLAEISWPDGFANTLANPSELVFVSHVEQEKWPAWKPVPRPYAKKGASKKKLLRDLPLALRAAKKNPPKIKVSLKPALKAATKNPPRVQKPFKAWKQPREVPLQIRAAVKKPPKFKKLLKPVRKSVPSSFVAKDIVKVAQQVVEASGAQPGSAHKSSVDDAPRPFVLPVRNPPGVN